MAIPKIRLVIASGVLIAGMGTGLLLESRTTARLQAENDSLRQQIEQLGWLGEENHRLSNQVAQAVQREGLTKEQFQDLLRLRGEVGVLRRQKEEMQELAAENEKLQIENRQLKSPPATPARSEFQFAERGIPKESWTFAGYATPEAAAQSMLWAMAQGDLNTLFGSFTAEYQSIFQDETRGKSEAELAKDLREGFAGVKSYYIVESTILSADEQKLSIAIEGAGDEKLVFKRIGNEWKVHR